MVALVCTIESLGILYSKTYFVHTQRYSVRNVSPSSYRYHHLLHV